ncbi:single-stranded-DNA-specific exonuclease RecJ [Geobacter sp. SVR]|uniref:single-stranded-DNA-specific exonuclease RecJ n=1 Tax=Geobacter sp. SVR TaxID=2495594 RepID=UPI00143EFE16|nr:single-stranded-DNA-specific exonuclease RecJ [Geobacter sp. SVR]BCS53788.1 single-stranded-DNA-specific exonuclease RecJ [Geobacter sp. SVR]GCF85703.1 single-stranded-DNA-specific exonuclease RecJ [Geobacter sp. SVR]
MAVLAGTAGSGIHPLLSAILAARAVVSPEDVGRFLAPALADMHDPARMKGMAAAVDRLLAAWRKRETVCIYGDYDVDGITGTALLVSFLREAGFICHYHIPNRFDDGYGINAAAVEQIAAGGAHLIVSVDCGITATEEAALCRRLGIDLIIVDHHLPGEQIPDAVAVINPLQPGCDYPFKSLAGVGVAFNLLVALRSALREQGAFDAASVPDLRRRLDLVALGTIADVVPLVGQNRIYAFHGLKLLSTTTAPGLLSLKQVAGIKGSVSCGQVGFRLAPRLNAAGRMECAVPGVELLLGNDLQETLNLASDLDAANAERQAVERSMLEEAIAMVEDAGDSSVRRSIVLASTTWHEGVVGIVASRLVERYHRPTVLIALTEDGHGKGSGRSIPGFHLLDALTLCASHLKRFGGHRYAAGIGLAADQVASFADAFEEIASRLLADEDLVPRLEIDAEVQPGDVTAELAGELKRLEPFGAGNPEPVLMMRGVTVFERREVGEGHLRLRLGRAGRSFAAIGFGMAKHETTGLVDIAFFPEMNVWNGSSSLQLRLKDLRPAE